MELLTEKQRKNLKGIFKGKKQTPEMRMAKSRILKELKSKGKTKFIKRIIGDLELLTTLYYGKPIAETFVDSLIIEAVKMYPEGKIDSLIHSDDLREKPKYETTTKEFNISEASAIMLLVPTQTGEIYRLLHGQLELSILKGFSKYLTQKEISEKTKLPKATVSRIMKELINEKLVECESTTSRLEYCCTEIP